MLSLDEFSVGTLGDVQAGLTFVLPRTQYEQRFLVSATPERRQAMFLDGSHRFHAFECSGNEDWKGLLVPSVRIEVDENTLFNPEEESANHGALVRSRTSLSVRAMPEQRMLTRGYLSVPLCDGLPSLPSGMSVGFRSWSIILGEGRDRRELMRIEVPSETRQPRKRKKVSPLEV